MAHLKTPKHITLRGHDFILSDVAADGSCMYRSVAVCMFHSVGINSDSFVRAGLGRSIDDDNFQSPQQAVVAILARWLKFYVHVMLFTHVPIQNIYFDSGIVNCKNIIPITTEETMQSMISKTYGTTMDAKSEPIFTWKAIPSLACVFKWLFNIPKKHPNLSEQFHQPQQQQQLLLQVYPLLNPMQQGLLKLGNDSPLRLATLEEAREKFKSAGLLEEFDNITIDMIDNVGFAEDEKEKNPDTIWQRVAEITSKFETFAGHSEILLLRRLFNSTMKLNNGFWNHIVIAAPVSAYIADIIDLNKDGFSLDADLFVLLQGNHYRPLLLPSNTQQDQQQLSEKLTKEHQAAEKRLQQQQQQQNLIRFEQEKANMLQSVEQAILLRQNDVIHIQKQMLELEKQRHALEATMHNSLKMVEHARQRKEQIASIKLQNGQFILPVTVNNNNRPEPPVTVTKPVDDWLLSQSKGKDLQMMNYVLKRMLNRQ